MPATETPTRRRPRRKKADPLAELLKPVEDAGVREWLRRLLEDGERCEGGGTQVVDVVEKT